jgi:aminopeptidase N
VGQYDFKDWHTLSNAREIHPRHLTLDISVDFDHKKISGSATWDIHPDTGVEFAVFDTRDLKIDSVLFADGSKAGFQLDKADPVLGSALRIQLKPNVKALIIFYQTDSNSTALQWLTPAQTFGKKAPFLYTQSESIYARSWIPAPDGPGIRFSYDAIVKVPRGLMALMSAENPQSLSDNGIYKFKMEQAIPAYLMALAVGDIGFKAVDERTGVYAEPAILDKAYKELDGLGKMVATAESIYGKYRWGRYDVLVLPSGFPLGGMENPRLTFCTPTILAGDKSLVNLIAHELAHSWSGNLVTNATWNDFWLNEGFTVYFERRITEAEYGKEYVDMLWDLGYQDMQAAVKELGENSKDTWLKLNLQGRDPDIGLTDVAYEKGAAFLRLIELTVGRERWDRFLNQYFKEHAFQSMTTERFLDYVNKHLLDGHEDWKKAINIEAWVYGPGIPENMPPIPQVRFEKVEQQIQEFSKNNVPAAQLATQGWSTYEWMHFLRNLPTPVSAAKMQELDQSFHFTQTGNSEIADIWFLQSLRANYTAAYPAMKEFLYITGREKFLEPLYEEMMKTAAGKKMAKDIYTLARPNYHPLAQKDIDKILFQN